MLKNNIRLFNTIGLFAFLGAIEDSNEIVLISSTVILIVIIASLLVYLFLTKPKGFKTDALEEESLIEANKKNKVSVFQLEETGEVSETELILDKENETDLSVSENEKNSETTEIELKV